MKHIPLTTTARIALAPLLVGFGLLIAQAASAQDQSRLNLGQPLSLTNLAAYTAGAQYSYGQNATEDSLAQAAWQQSHSLIDVKGRAIGQWAWHNPSFFLPKQLVNSMGYTLDRQYRTVTEVHAVYDVRLRRKVLTNLQYRYIKRVRN